MHALKKYTLMRSYYDKKKKKTPKINHTIFLNILH